MKAQRAYKFRLYPNKEQELLFRKTFGCCRFLYNRMLEDKIKLYRETGKMKRLTPAKYKAEYPWLRDVDSLALANVQLHLESAYKKFFKFHTGHPKYKSRQNTRSSYTTNVVNGNIRLESDMLRLPKVGCVKIRIHRNIPDEYILKSVTISKERSGKFYASLLYACPVCETPVCETNRKSTNILEIHFAPDGTPVFSDGGRIEYPAYCRNSEQRLVRLQKKLSNCRKGSRNYEKQKNLLIRCHEKVENQKKDYLHKLSREVADNYDEVVTETPGRRDSRIFRGAGIINMTDNYDEFRNMLHYKLADQGKEMIVIK